MEDAYEALITKESSALWSEVLRRKETRMMNTEKKEGVWMRAESWIDAFVVGTSRSAKRLSIERKSIGEIWWVAAKTEVNRDVSESKVSDL